MDREIDEASVAAPNHLRLFKLLHPRSMVAGILKHRVAVLVLIVVLSGLFAAFLPRLTVNTSVYDLVIEDIPENIEYLKFKEMFGSEEIIRVVIKSGNIFDPAVFSKIEQLADAVRAIPGVRRVISLPEVKRVVDPVGQWSLEKFQHMVADVAMFQRNLISDDRKSTLITLVLADDARPKAVIQAVQQLIDQSDARLNLYQIGMPLISQALGQFTANDFMRLPPITFLVIAIVLLVIFRRVRFVLLPLACVSLALTWTFGVVAMTAIPLSMLTMIVPVFLIAVGTAYCLHIVAAFRNALGTAETASDAVFQTYQVMAFPTFLAIATTVLSLGTLFLSRITAINEFALFACVGMFSFLVLLLTFLPAVLSYIPPEKSKTDKPREIRRPLQGVIDAIIKLHLHHQKKALWIIAGITLICLAGLLQLRVETNPVEFFKPGTEIHRHFHDIYQHLSGSFPINLTMAGPQEGFFEDPQNIAAIEGIQQYADSLPGVDKCLSFADYLKLVNYASNRFEPQFYRLPSEPWEMRMLINTYRSLLGPDMLTAFMSADFSQANILLLTHISNSRDFLRIRKQVLAHAASHFSRDLQWNLTGFGIVISASSDHLTRGQINSLSLTMFSIALIMLVLFLSYKVGLIAVLPNMFPIVVNFGIMGWLGIELSMATSLIASVAIGLAVDDTIHYLVRFNREFRKDLDDRRAMRAALMHIGRPIIYTTITISLGFAVLLFSSFKPTAIFGGMMIITMVAALGGDLILLPALMQRVELVTLWDLVRIKMGRDPELEISLFKGLSRTEMHSVMMAGTLMDVRAGELLFRKGDTSETMYAVISGSFDVFDYESDNEAAFAHGIQKKISNCHAGDIIGEMGLLRSAPRSATVVAAEDSELLLINWKVVQRVQWLYPPIAVKFFKNLARILSNRVERLTHCLANESCIDDLTGICNRKGLCQALESEVKRAVRYKEPVCLCLLEIDFDGYSPGRGEDLRHEMLQCLAQSWGRVIRSCDTLSRITVQRFLLLAPGMKTADMTHVRERMEAAAHQVRQQFNPVPLSLSISMLDLALGEDAHADGEQALTAALKAMGIDETNDRPSGNACQPPGRSES